VLAFAFAATVRVHATETTARVESNVAEVKGDAAKAALKDLDAEIDRVDQMIDHAPTAADKAAAKARMDVLKERRSELRKTYVSARYDELKADIRTEGNRVSSWTKEKVGRDPASNAERDIANATDDAKRDAKRAARDAHDSTYAYANSVGASTDIAAYKMRPTDTNKEEAKAALKALDRRIDELDDRADRMDRGPARDALKRRIKELEDRKDDLKHEFNKARFDALVDDVQDAWK
jgi:chromosome segregation ATPase